MQTSSLLSGRRLAKNAIWNLAGLTAPLVAAFFAVPILIEGMGKERFGLLSIVWMGIGYFTLFDVGLGRALTKLVAEHLTRKDSVDLQELTWTALWLVAALGIAAVIVVLGSGAWIINDVFNVPASLRGEGVSAVRTLAFGIPVVIMSSALTGILSAHQRFVELAVLRATLGAVTFLGPVVTLQSTPSLAVATYVLLAVRLLAAVLYFVLASRVLPELLRPVAPRRRWIKPLFSLGGWLTVTNIVSPIMTFSDRFLIASITTLSTVAFYVTPFEIVTRLMIVSGAVAGVLFPALATAFAADRNRLVALYSQSSRDLLLVMLPPVTIAFLFATEGLSLWLNDEFGRESTLVVQWLAAGVLINSLAQPPLALLQSAGRADLVAKAHLAELLPYAALLWALTTRFGIAGAAAAWTFRVAADALLLLWFARELFPDLGPAIHRALLAFSGFAMAFLLAYFIQAMSVRGVLAVAVCSSCGFLLWPSLRRMAIRG